MTTTTETFAHPGKPAIYTIAAGLPFVDALAAGLVARLGEDPESLADARVLLPTRRACRALREAFLRQSEGRALLLPRITPLGDLDEDELSLGAWEGGEVSRLGEDGAAAFEVPTALSGLRRQVLLTRLVMAIDPGGRTPEQAARLAGELGRLLDQVQTERLSFDRLADLVPEDLASHWQITLDFLRILSEQWPRILAEESAIDAADRRNRLLEAQARSWRDRPPSHPVIAAGSTGSIPATANLLAVIAELPAGCIVLPGLVRDCRPEVWAAFDPTHPQYGMARLLDRLNVAPADVADWPAPGFQPSTGGRVMLIERALRPADTIDGWLSDPPLREDALAGVQRIDCPGPREEAGVISLLMREALETPGRTAALITPDRALARRVAAELRRWDIDVDDSAGRPLDQTPALTLLRLAVRMAAEDFAPVALLAALKHPLVAAGCDPAAFRSLVRELELTILRGPRPAPGTVGLRRALSRPAPHLLELVDDLERCVEPLVTALAAPHAGFSALLKAHVTVAESLASTALEAGANRLWAGDAGEAAAVFVSELAEAAEALGSISPRDYPRLFDALAAGRVVRPRFGQHPRLQIWGPLEARLQQADLLILGGLNEGTWPPEAVASPWMSRPMMEGFGLPLPERRIGLAAHDFAQALAAPRVALTRATRVEGTPTVPSRWLSRIEALVRDTPLSEALRPETRWLRWHAALDDPGAPRPTPPPRPCPPVEDRPRELSVTRVETWIRDPYAIYARHILGLKPLDPLDAPPDAMERGIIIHEALDAFVRQYPNELPEDAESALLAIGEQVFRDTLDRPGVRAFWWPRFRRIARWFVAFERQRRADGWTILATEVRGAMDLGGPAGPFRLTARADRIERSAGGELAIADYKTGVPPSWRQVKAGLAPQLPLEASMAQAGTFEGIAPQGIAELLYLRLSGGHTPGESRILDKDIEALAHQTMEGLRGRIAAYDDPKTPYLSRPRPMFLSHVGDYDHLARVKEWASAGGEGT